MKKLKVYIRYVMLWEIINDTNIIETAKKCAVFMATASLQSL